jgi:phenylpropionate dioxygenase-like ring-hydroxylating dioxygenase large terminal subunit
MPPEAYIDQQWFARERTLFFKPLWQFIGLKMMLSQHNAFITRTLCGIPIVVQNFNGELRAFENLCAHRQNPLQTQPHGVRSLVCNYHGWGYAEDGKPNNIPFEAEAFRFSKEDRECLHLKRFKLVVIGNLVFINLSESPLPIGEQFTDEVMQSMAEVSNAFDSEVILTTFKGKFNWKLAYENLRDSHHPRYLHARSLYNLVKFQVLIDEQSVEDVKRLRETGIQDKSQVTPMLRSFSNGGLNEPMQQNISYPWHVNVERYGDMDWYYNWLAFPNLHIASGTGGYSFIIEHHIPVTADRTDFMVYFVTAKKKRRYATSAAVLHAHMMGSEKVLREDIAVLERIQAQMHPDASFPNLGDYEHANASIELWYLHLMEGKFEL